MHLARSPLPPPRALLMLDVRGCIKYTKKDVIVVNNAVKLSA